MGSGTLSKPQNKRRLHSCLPACWIPINLTALTKCPRIAEPVQSINIWHTLAQIQQALWASWQQHRATMMADHTPVSTLPAHSYISYRSALCTSAFCKYCARRDHFQNITWVVDKANIIIHWFLWFFSACKHGTESHKIIFIPSYRYI